MPPLAPFVLASGRGVATAATTVRVCWDDEALHLRFACDDRDIWGTLSRRDDPLWTEEAVEVFFACGEAVPAAYFELEVSPFGAIFDAVVRNPDGRRDTMVVESSWDAAGLRWAVHRDPARRVWSVEARIPWASVGHPPPPRILRANFFRIERPCGAAPEFSCWSPTFTDPADFHKPDCFGRLTLSG